MKKPTSKRLSLLLAIIMLLSMLPVTAFAASDPEGTIQVSQRSYPGNVAAEVGTEVFVKYNMTNSTSAYLSFNMYNLLDSRGDAAVWVSSTDQLEDGSAVSPGETFVVTIGYKVRKADVEDGKLVRILQQTAVDIDSDLDLEYTAEPVTVEIPLGQSDLPLYGFNEPNVETVNGVTAEVTFDKEGAWPEGTEVTATVTLCGHAAVAGLHTVALFSGTAEFWGEAQDFSVTEGQKVFTGVELNTYTFTIPAQAINDLQLDHSFVVPVDYTLYLYEGKGYEGASGCPEVELEALGINAELTEDGYKYTFDSVNFVTAQREAVCIADENATLELTGDSTFKGGSADTATVGMEVFGNLTVEGDGALNVFAGNTTSGGSDGIKMTNGSLMVNGGSIMAFSGGSTGWSFGIEMASHDSGDLIINDGEVRGFGRTGICANKGITVNGGVLEGISTGAPNGNSEGIFIYQDGLTVNGGEVRGFAVSARDNSYGIDVYGGKLTVDGGVVEGTSGEAERYYSYGIFASSDGCTVLNGGRVTGFGGQSFNYSSCGISSGSMTVEKGRVTGQSAEAKVHSAGINIYGNDLIINEDGVVEGFGGNYADFSDESMYSSGIIAWCDATVNGGRLNGHGGITASNSHGIIICGDLTANGGEIEGNGGEATGNSRGIMIDGDAEINGTNVIGNGGSANVTSIGIDLTDGGLIVNDGYVEGNGDSCEENTSNSYGINAIYDITVNGGNVIGHAGDVKVDSIGIIANHFLLNDGYINAFGGGADTNSIGLYVNESCTILGGEAELSGLSHATYCYEDEELSPITKIEGINMMAVYANTDVEADPADAPLVENWVGDGSDDVTGYKYMHFVQGLWNVYVSADPAEGGTATPSSTTANEGDEIILYGTANAGYTFKEWQVISGSVTVNGNKFTMPAENVTVKAIFEKLPESGGGGTGGHTPTYDYCTLTFDTNGGGSIAPITRIKGTTISLASCNPTRKGYDFTGWYADASLNTKVTSITLNSNKTIYAGWEKESATPSNPFIDVLEQDWFYDDVLFAFENDLITGTGGNKFSPEMTTTRGMIVTILYRLEGEPTLSGACPFDDVKSGMYYEKAITWAAQNNIVGGYGDNKFGPDDEITREQMAAILYRYADYKGYDLSAGENTNILSYEDAFDISDYAYTPFQWACGEGLINGMGDGNLAPQGNATRAQIAAILHRFIEKFVK